MSSDDDDDDGNEGDAKSDDDEEFDYERHERMLQEITGMPGEADFLNYVTLGRVLCGLLGEFTL